MRTDDDPDWAVRKALLVDVYIVYMVLYMFMLPILVADYHLSHELGISFLKNQYFMEW